MSTSLSCLLGVSVCLSNSEVIFLLLRLFQGSALAGVFVSSYITRESPLTNGRIVNPVSMEMRCSTGDGEDVDVTCRIFSPWMKPARPPRAGLAWDNVKMHVMLSYI